jgi:tail protein
MAITSMRLVNGTAEMLLAPRDGVFVQQLDVPWPAMRDVVEERTDDDGEIDSTQLHGGRSVSVQLLVTDSPAAVVDELAAFTQPRMRPYLVVADDEWSSERRLRLRVDQLSAPIGVDLPPDKRLIQAQWRAPDGVWEAPVPIEATISADIQATVGISFPISFPLAFAATQATGAQIVNNPGTVPAHFTARLYGPCTAPRLINETTGEEIAFTSSLMLAAGEYVEINTRNRTALLLSMASQSRLTFVDFAATSWWQIASGEQTIRYAPFSASVGAVAVIDYRPAWL